MRVTQAVESEPVRLSGYAALVVGFVLSAGFLWATGADVRQIVGSLAMLGLTSIGGLEWARAHVRPVGTPTNSGTETTSEGEG